MGASIDPWVLAALPGIATVLVVVALADRHDADLRRSLARLRHSGSGDARPSGLVGLMARIGRTVAGRRAARYVASSAALDERIRASAAAWTADELAGLIITLAILVAVGCVSAAAFSPMLLLLLPVGLLLAVRLPGIVIARRARRRRRHIENQIPELVELLVAASESGLPPPAAFVRSAEALDAPLGEELRAAAARIRMGEPWRVALDGVVEATRAPSLATLARSLERSGRLGVSVRGTLRALIDEFRAERRARAEEKARRAPVKMLFPLVFLILPAFLLLTVGPVLLSTVRSLH